MSTEEFYFERVGQERFHVGQRTLLELPEADYRTPPRIGLVISTYGAVPFVHLSLAMRKKFYPTLPALVHDDASPNREALRDLCAQYDGVEFESNSSRLGHQMGDLSASVGGLLWAKERGIELMVKQSQRFVPVQDWPAELGQWAAETQMPTYSMPCKSYGFNLRSECMAVSVRAWSDEKILPELTKFMLTNHLNVFIEHVLYHYAGIAHSLRPQSALRREAAGDDSLLVTPWPFLTGDRRQSNGRYLWYSSSPKEAYARLAAELGLNYPVEAFEGQSRRGG